MRRVLRTRPTPALSAAIVPRWTAAAAAAADVAAVAAVVAAKAASIMLVNQVRKRLTRSLRQQRSSARRTALVSVANG